MPLMTLDKLAVALRNELKITEIEYYQSVGAMIETLNEGGKNPVTIRLGSNLARTAADLQAIAAKHELLDRILAMTDRKLMEVDHGSER